MIRIGKRFLKPHFCPDCHKLVILARHPAAVRCPKCQKKARRKAQGHKAQQNKYNATYQRQRKRTIKQQPYCALCGSCEHLTCHHAVRVKTGEWKGKHLTVLCDSCHQIWEKKVNKVRDLYKLQGENHAR